MKHLRAALKSMCTIKYFLTTVCGQVILRASVRHKDVTFHDICDRCTVDHSPFPHQESPHRAPDRHRASVLMLSPSLGRTAHKFALLLSPKFVDWGCYTHGKQRGAGIEGGLERLKLGSGTKLSRTKSSVSHLVCKSTPSFF